LMRMRFKLIGNAHIFGAFQNLRINDISYDGLVFARQIFVEKLGQAVPGNFLFAVRRLSGH